MRMEIYILPIAVTLATLLYFAFKAKKPTPVPSRAPIREGITMDDWLSKLKQHRLESKWDHFKALLKDEIVIHALKAHESSQITGASKIGGRPDLPKRQNWFKEDNGKSLSFLAQINFSQTKPYDRASLLPDRGIVYFFFSAGESHWGTRPDDKDKFKVFYFDGDASAIRRKDWPEDLPAEARFQSCDLEFTRSIGRPHNEVVFAHLPDEEAKADALLSSFPDQDTTKLLGHADYVQVPMEGECHELASKVFGPNNNSPSDWKLLFQIHSIGQAGMMWGDAGMLYFWIQQEDLKNKRFDRCWMILQCS